ncbi:MAG TPA: sulfatase, partial [Pirellulaceae bacterium]|nr:sulfatase [Pirellulaceae bacterium]
MNASEKLLPELLKERGYATAIFGKWHLGDSPEFLPKRHGFDDYFGLPYSNDMWPNHPTSKTYPPLPLIDGDRVVATNPDQTQLTTWSTERAVRFIEQNKDRPFFLYVPHSMPHVPLFVSEKFRGKSERGLFGDVISELDWSVGQILETLRKTGVDDNTLVLFTSDNGPWLSYGDHAGNAGPLREGKGTTWEGGTRVPALARWPGRVPAGRTCDEFCSTLDVLPTLVKLAGGATPTDRVIDGHDAWPLWSGVAGAKSPYEVFYYYWEYRLEAIRSGPWKLHFPHDYRSLKGDAGTGGQPGPYVQKKTERQLFNLAADIGEQVDRSAENPEVVARLEQLATHARRTLGDTLQSNARGTE